MKNRLKKIILGNNLLYFFIGQIVFRKFNFSKIKPKRIDSNWGFLVCKYKLTLSTDNLVALLNSGNGYQVSNLEETPHYKFINNFEKNSTDSNSSYEDYLKSYFETLDVQSKMDNFIHLRNNIADNHNELFICIKKEFSSFKSNKFKILDGLHRATIAKHLSIKEISCYIVDEITH